MKEEDEEEHKLLLIPIFIYGRSAEGPEQKGSSSLALPVVSSGVGPGRSETAIQKMINWLLIRIAALACIGGFLMGYDLGLIGGALVAMKTDPLVGQMSIVAEEIIVGAFKLGAFFGTFVGGALMLRYGRRKALASTCIATVAGPIIMACSTSSGGLVMGRLVGGFGIGASATIAPTYMAEVAPPKRRGAMVLTYEVMLCFGNVSANVVDYLLQGAWGSWRWMVGLPAAPAALMALCLFLIPESPRWLVMRGDSAAASATLLLLLRADRGEEEVEAGRGRNGEAELAEAVQAELLMLFGEVDRLNSAAVQRQGGYSARSTAHDDGSTQLAVMPLKSPRNKHFQDEDDAEELEGDGHCPLGDEEGLAGAEPGSRTPAWKGLEQALAAGCQPGGVSATHAGHARSYEFSQLLEEGQDSYVQHPHSVGEAHATSFAAGHPHHCSTSHAAGGCPEAVQRIPESERSSSDSSAVVQGAQLSDSEEDVWDSTPLLEVHEDGRQTANKEHSRRGHKSRPGFETSFAGTLIGMLRDIYLVATGPESRAFSMAMWLAFFNQANASTAVINFAPSLMQQMEGMPARLAVLTSSSITIMKTVGVIAGTILVDQVGRRPLLSWGAYGCSAAMLATALSLGLAAPAWCSLAALSTFMLCFSASWAGAFWVLTAEVFSLAAKSPGVSAATAMLFLTGSLTNVVFLSLLDTAGSFSFIVFALVSAIAGVYVHMAVPETKGKALEEIHALMQR